MFGRFRTNYEEQLRLEKERLQTMGEKELLIEMIMELKRIDQKCDDIARKIVIWRNLKLTLRPLLYSGRGHLHRTNIGLL